VKIPTATRNAACQALVSLFDAGSGPGYIEIRTGAGPATPNDAAFSASGMGGELELNTVTISVGVDVAVTGWTINMPQE
jgi:hypothetical protein